MREGIGEEPPKSSEGRAREELLKSSEDCLPRLHVKEAALVLDAQQALQDDGVLVEVGRPAGLDPAGRAAPVGDADAGLAAVDPLRPLSPGEGSPSPLGEEGLSAHFGFGSSLPLGAAAFRFGVTSASTRPSTQLRPPTSSC